MRGTKQIAAILVALAMASGLVGCGRVEDGLYHYDYGPRRHAPGPDQVEEMVSTCALTPSDILMIDLQGQPAAATLEGGTCEQIVYRLTEYRNSHAPEPESLLDNPAKRSSPPSLVGIKYAVLSSSNGNWVSGYGVPSQVFVDFVNNNILFAQYEYVLIYPYYGTTAPLNSSSATAFLQSLCIVATWGDPWVEKAGDAFDLYQWQVAIVTADDQLYRWEVLRPQRYTGPGATPDLDVAWPPGLLQVYDAFWALTVS